MNYISDFGALTTRLTKRDDLDCVATRGGGIPTRDEITLKYEPYGRRMVFERVCT